MSGLKDEKLTMQTYMKTETYKLYSRDLWIFLPKIIEIDLYNYELYRFKVGAFFETPCSTHSALQVSHFMRDINSRLTYLLTYLLEMTLTIAYNKVIGSGDASIWFAVYITG